MKTICLYCNKECIDLHPVISVCQNCNIEYNSDSESDNIVSINYYLDINNIPTRLQVFIKFDFISMTPARNFDLIYSKEGLDGMLNQSLKFYHDFMRKQMKAYIIK